MSVEKCSMRTAFRTACLALMIAMSFPLHAASGQLLMDDTDPGRKIYVSQGTFEDVRENLELAITGRGMVISSMFDIGDMLSRTGGDIGVATAVFADAQALAFCSAVLSREMMEADPHDIVNCPYVIAVYSLAGEANRVYVAFRRPAPADTDASKWVLRKVEALLDDIVAESLIP